MTTTNSASALSSTPANRATQTDEATMVEPVPYSLPDEPLVVIEPGKFRLSFRLREIWAYRELLYFLMWRDVKVRYKQTLLGLAWVVLQPLLTTLIFTVFLGRVVRVPSDNIPYPLFVYTGMILWAFFATAVTSGGGSLVGNAHLITKVYFPRMIIPAAAVGARVFDFVIAFVILLGFMFFYDVPLTRGILFMPVFVLLAVALALAIGLWTSALNVKYRDIGVALPVIIQLWMFVSPVIYPSSLVSPNWQGVYALNPLTGIIEGFRASLLGLDINWFNVAISTASALILLAYSAYAFRRLEKNFADII